jgi:acetylornithine deacetylase/succinyl-diaminopimelate desuccinylase-like protein
VGILTRLLIPSTSVADQQCRRAEIRARGDGFAVTSLAMNPAHVDLLFEFLRFASVSTDPTRAVLVDECARWLGGQLIRAGLHAEVHDTGGHPVVVARNEHRAGRRTVLIYGHYDVQPEDPVAEWKSPPFQPVIRDGVIFARGSTDNKGQILAHILGVAETLKTNGDLPVNLIFLIEGEEEIGSKHLEGFLKAHAKELRCDVIAVSDTGMIAPGVPTFSYGLRGILTMELRVNGPSTDLHSGLYGGAVANPATVVARLLATLHDADGRVLVPGFYENVRPLADWERKAWSQLPFGDAQMLAITGSPGLFGEVGYSSVERTWARPTAEVNGIGGGFQGVGSKTVLPREAFAKLSFRLVPDQTPAEIAEKVTAHFRAQAAPGVTVEVTAGHSGEPYATDPNSAFGEAAQRALRRAFPGKEVALIREGGSIPIINTFKRILGVDTLLLGLALPDCGAHGPNENFPVANFEAGIRLNQALLEELAR